MSEYSEAEHFQHSGLETKVSKHLEIYNIGLHC